ncbi:hypothetical protein LTR94_027164, partial [Friedmanniomyces endolithicus]
MISLAEFSAERLDAARQSLQRTGRAQLQDVLTSSAAENLSRAAAAAPFNVVTRRGTGHVDLPAAWLSSLSPDQKQKLGQAIQAAAVDDFQYLYDNHPIFDLAGAGQAEATWAALVDFLNAEPFLSTMRSLTGEPRIAMADAQLTRFRAGHFLTEHDDHAEGKNRYFAYVLNLTPVWRAEWGGLLLFHGADGNIVEGFTP